MTADEDNDLGRMPPHDVGAEQSVLGSLLSGRGLEKIAPVISPADHFRPAHQAVHEAVAALAGRGEPYHAVAVGSELLRRGQLERAGGLPYLHTLAAAASPSPEYDAGIVAKAAARRHRIEAFTRGLQLAWNPAADLAAVDAAVAGLADLAPPGTARRRAARELTEFLDADDPEYDWLVPGLLERGDRLILTGSEGGGKSTLLRQIGVQVASGVNPFGGEDFPPRRVLLADVENSEPQTRRKLRPIHLALRDVYEPKPGLYIENRQQGLDLSQPEDQQWLTGHVRDTHPELLITGPLYKLMGGDPTSEEVARAVSGYFDRLRAEFGVAVILEAHTPHAATAKGSKRPERPYGASLWLRWPEFGIYLSPEGFLRHWRGQRDERNWPAALQRGGYFPWTVVTRARDVLWARIAEACTEAGDQLAERDLAQLLGVSQPTVHRAIEEHRQEWGELAARDP